MDKLSSAFDSLSRKVQSYRLTPLEKRVAEATSNDNWGVANSSLIELARLTSDYNTCATVMKGIAEGISEKKEKWRRIFKSLTLLEYCVKFGSDRVADQTRAELLFKIRPLQEFRFMEDGRDRGSGIREKSKELYLLVTDPELLRSERLKARQGKEKYVGITGNTVVTPVGYATDQTVETAKGGSDSFPKSPDEIHSTSKLDEYRQRQKKQVQSAPKIAFKQTGTNKPSPPAVAKKQPFPTKAESSETDSSETDSSGSSGDSPKKFANLIDFGDEQPVSKTPQKTNNTQGSIQPQQPYQQQYSQPQQPHFTQQPFYQPQHQFAQPAPQYTQPHYSQPVAAQYSQPQYSQPQQNYSQYRQPLAAQYSQPVAQYSRAAEPTNPFSAFNGI